MAKALDILRERHGLLNVAIMGRVAGKDGIVDNDAVNLIVIIGAYNLLFQSIFVYLAQVESEATNLLSK